MSRSRHSTWAADDVEEEQRKDGFEEVGIAVEDAILELGRIMKGAGKGLWRKVSGSDLRKRKQRDSGIMPSEDGCDEEVTREVSITRGTGGDGGGDDMLLSIGETDTIVDGSVTFSWMEVEDDKSSASTR